MAFRVFQSVISDPHALVVIAISYGCLLLAVVVDIISDCFWLVSFEVRTVVRPRRVQLKGFFVVSKFLYTIYQSVLKAIKGERYQKYKNDENFMHYQNKSDLALSLIITLILTYSAY